MARSATRVVLLSLDAFPHDGVSAARTPRLAALAKAGGLAPDGGRCPLPSATYSSHATLLTGRLPAAHGVWSGLAAEPRAGVVPGWAGRDRVVGATLFTAGRAAGARCASIAGDHHLARILGAGVADLAWPPNGVPPEGEPVDDFGYLRNDAVRPHLLAAASDPELAFLFAHLNEPDTWGHVWGPDHPETLAACARTDALVGETLDALGDDWARTVAIVVSDHGMVGVGDAPPIDALLDADVRELVAEVLSQGGSALARPRSGIAPERAARALAGVAGVGACRVVGPELLLVEGEPGRRFAVELPPRLAGYHGGSDAARTLALVGGGHPAVSTIAAAIRARPPDLADWAPTIAALLGWSLPGADGRNLAAS